MNRVLITGAAGYVGSSLVLRLLEQGYRVRGLDALMFGGESLLGAINHREFDLIVGDVRDGNVLATALEGVDAVVHLAAIVGDPACARNPDLAEEVNWVASARLLDLCLASGSVRQFVFASTCSNYGKMKGEAYVDETSPLRPVSLYARLKVRFEEYLLSAPARDGFAATALRFATAYGLSPRPRFDLTVNEFAREVAMRRSLEIFGEQFWRPYCHVTDLAAACIAVLQAPPEVVAGEVFGAGDTRENYQKQMIAEILREMEPAAEIRYVHRDEDPRDYRVDFSKIRRVLGFAPRLTVRQGAGEIFSAIRRGVLKDPDATAFRNT
ncbi:MAG: NAD(P)-dependent oxidoreductase [Armatimonadetes bacterium]|nr:NAD(P)-dependent oxidoreductase [Armatimonadota bacterium]